MNEQNEFLLYTAPDGAVKVDVFFKDETVWLTQKAMSGLFGVKVPGINKHLKNIFDSRELSREATVSKMEMVRPEGGRDVLREVEFYNLDAIIVTKMAEWETFLNRFLEFSNYPILRNKGKVSALEGKLKAEAEYDVYRKRQDVEYVSDFDREIKRIEGKKE